MQVKVTQSCPTLCHSMDFSPPGSTVHGISRQEYWSGLPFPSVGDLPNPGIDPRFPVLQAKSFLSEPPENPKVCVLAVQSCPTLCNPMDCSLPASSVHGILQTKILEWVALTSFRGSFLPVIAPKSLMSSALAGRFFTSSTTWEDHNSVQMQ